MRTCAWAHRLVKADLPRKSGRVHMLATPSLKIERGLVDRWVPDGLWVCRPCWSPGPSALARSACELWVT